MSRNLENLKIANTFSYLLQKSETTNQIYYGDGTAITTFAIGGTDTTYRLYVDGGSSTTSIAHLTADTTAVVQVQSGNYIAGNASTLSIGRTDSVNANNLNIKFDGDDLVSVGLGTTSPSSMLEVSGTVQAKQFYSIEQGQYLNTTASLSSWASGSGIIYRETGNVGIGTTSPAHALDIKGTVNISGSEYSGSGTAHHDRVAMWLSGSVIPHTPEGTFTGSYDLGSLENPFQDLYLYSGSLVMVGGEGQDGTVQTVRITANDFIDFKQGKSVRTRLDGTSKPGVIDAAYIRGLASAFPSPVVDSNTVIYMNGNDRVKIQAGGVTFFDADEPTHFKLGDSGNTTHTDVVSHLSASRDLWVSGSGTVVGNLLVRGDATINNNLTIAGTYISSSAAVSMSGNAHIGVGNNGQVHTTQLWLTNTNGGIYQDGNLRAVYNSDGAIHYGTQRILNDVTSSANISSSGTITAEHLYSRDDAVIDDDLSVGGELTVTGDATLNGSINSDSTIVFNKGIDLYGSVTASGNVTVTGSINNFKPNFLAKRSNNEFIKMGVNHYENSPAYIGWYTDEALAFGTYNSTIDTTLSTKMIISSSGYVGIGVTNPPAKLTVLGDISASGTITANDIYLPNDSISGNLISGGTIGATTITNLSGTNIVITNAMNVANHITASGNISASKFYGDGTNLTGITAEWDGTRDGDATIDGHITASGVISASGGFVGDGTNITGVTAEWDGTHTGNATFNGNISVTGNITASGHIFGDGSTNIYNMEDIEAKKLISDHDSNTYIDFNTNDKIQFYAGGEQLLELSEYGTDRVTVGDGGNVDFQVKTDGDDYTIFAYGYNDNVGIGVRYPSEKLEVRGNLIASSSRFNGTVTSSGDGYFGVGNNGKVHTTQMYLTNTNGGIYQDGNLRVVYNSDGAIHYGTQRILNPVTASNDISSSGIITANKAAFINLPTTDSGLSTGDLYTRSGSQILASGSASSEARTKFNAYSGSKFVLMK